MLRSSEIILFCLLLLLPLLVPGEAAGSVISSPSPSCYLCDDPSAWVGICSNCSTLNPVSAWVNEGQAVVHVHQKALEHCKANDTGLLCAVSFLPNATAQHGNCCRVARHSCSLENCTQYVISNAYNATNHGEEIGLLQFPTFFTRSFGERASSSRNTSLTTYPTCNKSSGEACSKKANKLRRYRVYIIGGVAVVGALTLLSCLILLRNRKLLKSKHLSSSERAQILVGVTGSQSPTVFTFKELKSATKSFSESRLLGGGGFSTVYQGKLPDGRVVAVKKLNQGNKQGIQQFQNEVNILSKVRHANLVQLLGYCLEGRDLLLVYEYVLNGTLADHLHGDRGNGLSMETRLAIALDTAHALAYLHFDVNPPIYHRDVKSSNILLDKDFKAKVADFGLSRLTHLDATHISTAPQGTPGYLDPDYHESYQLTDKSDVYSFGVVLLELVSRKKAVDMSRDKKEINLASMALARIHSGALHELFDPELSVKYWKLLTRLVEVSFRCLAAEKDDRPSMVEVVAELEQLSSIGVMSFSSRRKIKLDSSGEFKRLRSSSNNSNHSNHSSKLEEESPTSVQMKWPSTHTSPSNSRSEEALLKQHKFSG